jgi:O-antigen/teichoic acid export membrane protein
VYSLTFWSGVVGTVAVAAILLRVHRDLSSSLAIALSLGMGFVLFGTHYVAATFSVARGMSRVALAEVPYLVSGLGKFFVIAVAAVAGASDLGWVGIGYGAAGIVNTLVCMRLARSLVGPGPALFGRSVKTAARLVPMFLPYAIAAIATHALARLDVVVLGIAKGSHLVGLYEPTLKLTEQLMVLVPVLLGTQFLPVATRMVVRGDDVELRRLFSEVTKLSFVLAMPVALLLAAFPRSVVSTLYGADFELNRTVVWILLGGFVANVIGGPNLGALIATGHRRALLTATFIAFGTMIVLAVTLIPAFGITGAAVATAVSLGSLNVSVTISFWRVKRMHPYSAEVATTLALGILPAAAMFGIRSVMSDGSLIAGAFVSGAVWLAWLAGLLAVGLVRLPGLKGVSPGGGRVE